VLTNLITDEQARDKEAASTTHKDDAAAQQKAELDAMGQQAEKEAATHTLHENDLIRKRQLADAKARALNEATLAMSPAALQEYNGVSDRALACVEQQTMQVLQLLKNQQDKASSSKGIHPQMASALASAKAEQKKVSLPSTSGIAR
jgi:hypothetical protein